MTTPKPARRARAWWCVAGVAVLLAAAAAYSWPEPTEMLDVTTLRIGLDAVAMPVSTGERDYVGDGLEASFAQDLAQPFGVPVVLVSLAPAQLHDALATVPSTWC